MGHQTTSTLSSSSVNLNLTIAPGETHEADYTITVPKEFAALHTYTTAGSCLSFSSINTFLVLHVRYLTAKVEVRCPFHLSPRLGPLRGVPPPLLPSKRDAPEFTVTSQPDHLPWYFYWA